MKRTSIFLMLVCCLFSNISFAQDLNQKINYSASNKNLEQILNDLGDSYDVSFSYMNNELPSTRMDVEFEGITIDQALTNLLDNLELEHLIHNGKVIIKKRAKIEVPPTPAITASDTIKQEKPKAVVQEPVATEPIEVATDTMAEAENEPVTLPEQEELMIDPNQAVDFQGAAQLNKPVDNGESEPFTPTIKVYGKDSLTLELAKKGEDYKNDTTFITEEKINNLVHVGLFYPFSSNGYMAGKYINKASFHFLSGYSGGLQGFEMSGVANITKGDVEGFQMSGVTNIVDGELKGTQISGVTNVVKGDATGLQITGGVNVAEKNMVGAQLAGGVNVSKGDISGFQMAMGVNVSEGSVKFGQVAGFINIARRLDGPQFAGFLNVQKGEGNGLQVAGFLNQARNIKGGQVSGFINKARDVEGVQIAPFVNTARKVKGTQLGLINVSEQMDGTPIGLLNIVKRNGYYDLELFYADDFQANAIIKLGAKHFHNLFAFSYETTGLNRWAYGYGFGSQWGDGGFRVNTDLLSYYIVENKFPNGGFTNFDLNLLSKFRLLASIHMGSFGIFAGPTFNVLTSKYKNPETGKIGSDIGPKALWEATDSSGTNVKIWIGYNVGIRF